MTVEFPESLVDATITAMDFAREAGTSTARAATVAVLRALAQEADRRDAVVIAVPSFTRIADTLEKRDACSRCGKAMREHDAIAWCPT